jgi:hypothetical protein
LRNTVVSSAYRKQVEPSCKPFCMSLTYRLNKKGPKLESCVTPNVTSASSDCLSFTWTNCFLNLKTSNSQPTSGQLWTYQYRGVSVL